MLKIIILFLSALLLLSHQQARAVSPDVMVRPERLEASQSGSGKCMVGALYLETLCLVADGNPAKCTLMSTGLFGLPCVLFGGILEDGEVTMEQCMIVGVYIQTGCLACDGNALKCTALASFAFYIPCMYRATTNYSDTGSLR